MILNKLLFDTLSSYGVDFSAFSAEQNKRTPYAVYTIVSNVREGNLSVKEDFRNKRYQIDIYANSIEEAQTIGESYESLLFNSATFHAIINDGFAELDDESKSYRYMIDFNLHTI